MNFTSAWYLFGRGARAALAGVCVFALGACAKKAGSDHAGHDHAHAAGEAGEDVHVAPHGGTLVELGEHEFNLEFLHDPAAGKLTVWVLDAHAENFVRVPLDVIELNLGVVGPLKLTPVANAATGETVGDTSQFEITAPALRAPGPFHGVVLPIAIRGAKFGPIEVHVAPPAPKDAAVAPAAAPGHSH